MRPTWPGDHRDVHGGLRQLSAQFHAFQPPGLDANYLTKVTAGQNFHYGTSAQVIAQRYSSTQSGLIVPEDLTRMPAPIDQVLIYLTIEDVFGAAPDPSYIGEELRVMTASVVLQKVSEAICALRRPGLTRRQVDEAFTRAWFKEPYRSRVLVHLKEGKHALIVPQVLLTLAKLALIYSGDELVGGAKPGNFAGALLSLAYYLGSDPVGESEVIDKVPGLLGREVMANHYFNAEVDEINLVARFFRRWFQPLAEGHNGGGALVDLKSAFEEELGVSLLDFISVGIGAWAASVNGKFKLPPDYFRHTSISMQRINKVLNLTCAEIGFLRGQVILWGSNIGFWA